MGSTEHTIRRGVTLVELLVVLAALATLLGILAPALSSARSSAREAGCAAMQNQLFLSVIAWSMEHDDELPGVNTSGHVHGDIFAQQNLLGNTRASSPTTSFDWMSPALGAAADLSPNRAERTAQLFDRFACPEARHVNDALWGWAPDIGDFQTIHEQRGFTQISYLSPAAFHLYGPRGGGPIRGLHYGWQGPVVTPVGYQPRLEKIGKQPAQKIFLADGTRYVGGTGLLDFDVSVAPDYFSSFTSSGPIYVASTAYGVSRYLASAAERGGRPAIDAGAPQHNRDLSYRHRGAMGTLRFDGSFLMLTERESKASAVPWYPSGSEFTGFRATPAASETHTEGEILW